MAYLELHKAHDWTFPVPIAYGPGRLAEIASFCTKAGSHKPLIVTDRGSVDLHFIDQIQQYLSGAGMMTAIYSDISPNPRDDEIAAGRAMYREGKHDGIIAIGGGSGMDGGKAICLTANNDIELLNFNYDRAVPDVIGQPFPPLITIPTTAGTGAETESTGMITDTTRRMKLCIWHPLLKPSVALLDPELTIGLPANLTAWTGCDAMIHAIEAYCVPGLHPLCDGVALEALRLIHAWLPSAVEKGDSVEARGGMLLGSCLAGVAFLKGLGLVHAISHMVGAEYDTHHGLTNAIVLPAALRFNAPNIRDKVPAMAVAMQTEGSGFDEFYATICSRLDQFEIPNTLVDIGVPRDCVKEMARRAYQDAAASTNPRKLTVSDIEGVIEDALTTGR